MARLASELGYHSEKSEAANAVPISEIYSWASQLACESRSVDWIFQWYVWPYAVREIVRKLRTMNGGIIGLVGLQGVGKSSALLAIEVRTILLQHEEYTKEDKSDKTNHLGEDIVRFKWRRRSELIPSLLDNTHEASGPFQRVYLRALISQLKAYFPHLISQELEENPKRLNQNWAAKALGKSSISAIQHVSWLNMLLEKKLILIDTPDYSKTDRRLMARDLDEIYWLWNTISLARDSKPNIVVAIQKEMFRDHFFFDKMEKIELDPLEPREMVDAYRKRFNTTQPFTENALLTLARMSRGIFRRFLKYVNLALSGSPNEGSQSLLDTAVVEKAVTVATLAEDMELEFQEIFPKQSELRFLAVKLFLILQERGHVKQSELARLMDVQAFTMSRLLGKLELSKYITRTREGTDKLVSVAARTSS